MVLIFTTEGLAILTKWEKEPKGASGAGDEKTSEPPAAINTAHVHQAMVRSPGTLKKQNKCFLNFFTMFYTPFNSQAFKSASNWESMSSKIMLRPAGKASDT